MSGTSAPSGPSIPDLIRDSLDEGEAAAAAATAAIAGAPAPHMENAVLSHAFCLRLDRLLSVLMDTFPEREKLAIWAAGFRAGVLGNEDMEKYVIKKWHYDMTHDSEHMRRSPDLYELTRLRRIDELFSQGLWVFDEIDVRGMYYDPSLTDEDRENICAHFDAINGHACLQHSIPNDMLSAIQKCTNRLDPRQPITPETVQMLIQDVIGCDPKDLVRHPETADRLMDWATQLTQNFAAHVSSDDPLRGIQGLVNNATMKEATGLDMGELMRTLMGEIEGSHAILHSEADDLDSDQLSAASSAVTSAMANLSLGGSLGGGSGAPSRR